MRRYYSLKNSNIDRDQSIIFRLEIAGFSFEGSLLSGQIELDESYFGARRIRGKRGRGATGKTSVFGVLKGDGNVYSKPS